MSLDFKNHVDTPPLPTDITQRAHVYRRQGVIASLISMIASISANRRLARASRRFHSGDAPMVPAWLREDLGLPPEPKSGQIEFWNLDL
jgi:hypothetical protein